MASRSANVPRLCVKRKMGALDYLAYLCNVTTTKSTRKPMQTVEIKVKMDCDGCERRVKNSVKHMRGVRSVEVNRKISQLKVSGFVDRNKVLHRVKSYTGKRAEFWPYIPYNIVQHPHVAQVYDKKAPAGFVRNVAQTVPVSNSLTEEKYTTLFSDDNPNACSIM